jgi:hypothetical protein
VGFGRLLKKDVRLEFKETKSRELRGLQASESSCHLLWLWQLPLPIHQQDACPKL